MFENVPREERSTTTAELVLCLISIAGWLFAACAAFITGVSPDAYLWILIPILIAATTQTFMVGLRCGFENIAPFSGLEGKGPTGEMGCLFLFFIVPITIFLMIVHFFKLIVMTVICYYYILKEYKKTAILVLALLLAVAVFLCCTIGVTKIHGSNKALDLAETTIREGLIQCSGDIVLTPKMVEAIKKDSSVAIKDVWDSEFCRLLIAERMTELLTQKDYDGILNLVCYLSTQEIYLDAIGENSYSILFADQDFDAICSMIRTQGTRTKTNNFSYLYKGTEYTVTDGCIFIFGENLASFSSVSEWRSEDNRCRQAIVVGPETSKEIIYR